MCASGRWRSADIDFATALTHQAGWASESLDVFRAFLAHDATAGFIAEAGGEKAGVCIATKYAGNGFIGELVVSRHLRLLGIGQLLFQKALDHLLATGVERIFLDGDLNAVSYYEKMGFRKLCRSLRFRGKFKGKKHAHVHPLQADELDRLCALDRELFGDDRGFFLRWRAEKYPRLCLVSVRQGRINGWIMARPGDGVLAVGPWAALEPARMPPPSSSTWPASTAPSSSASESWKRTLLPCSCFAPGPVCRKGSTPGSWSGEHPDPSPET